MKKNILLTISILIIGFIIYLLIDKNNLESEGNAIISKIEIFKISNNRLPNSMSELGIKEEMMDLFYYEKNDITNSYLVWYGTILGESVTYDSTTKKWNY
ncbi:conserved hypothetical protein [Tenacibaculum litopenaei]|uniref:hypothetical protein n=1 Tax=Tenacibaculum litopenaei TaxID=396016 RepID=UPI003893902B